MPNKKNAAAKTANQRLVDERHRRQWSQQELANLIGTTPLNVSRWERGVTSPSPYFRQRLCSLFNKSPYELGLLPEPLDPSAFFAAPEQTDPQTGPLLSEPERDEGAISPSLGEKEAMIPPSADEKEQVTLEPALKVSGGRPAWPPSIGRISTHWSILLSVVLALVLVTGAVLWVDGIPTAKSKEHVSPVVKGGGSRIGASALISSSDSNMIPAAYAAHGQLVLDDPLTSAHTQGAWHITDPNNPYGCRFLKSGYDMAHNESNYCLADQTDFVNFVYQIEMTAMQGEMGGIVFRVNDDQDFYYSFQIGVDGRYKLYRSNPASDGSDVILATGWAPDVVQGYHQHNLLAVKAIADDISVYVNFHLVAHIQDRTYTHGNVGIAVTVDYGQKETEETFRDAKVWAIGK